MRQTLILLPVLAAFSLAVSPVRNARALENTTAPYRPVVTPRFTVEPGHPWRPPFGLDRVGRPLDAVVQRLTSSPAKNIRWSATATPRRSAGRW